MADKIALPKSLLEMAEIPIDLDQTVPRTQKKIEFNYNFKQKNNVNHFSTQNSYLEWPFNINLSVNLLYDVIHAT